jgi:Winged helix domain
MTDKQQWGEAPFQIHLSNGRIQHLKVSGRDRWALESLIKAESTGCTPVDTPGPRWSAYVFNLRALGVSIETIHEAHSGPFAGSHARYVLQSIVSPAQRDGEAA